MLDANNHPVKKAKVKISNAQGLELSNVTDTNGGFILNGISFGNSTLRFEASGYVSSEWYLFDKIISLIWTVYCVI